MMQDIADHVAQRETPLEDEAHQRQTERGLEPVTEPPITRPKSGWGPALWIASGMYIAADLRNHEPLRTMITNETVKTAIVVVAVIAVFIVYLALRASEFRLWRRQRPPRTVETALDVATACDTYEKNLCEAKLFGQDLRSVNWNGAKCLRIGLEGANLAGSHLNECDLRDGFLRRVNFSRCDLEGADLRGADIRGADFTGANLQSANFHGARIGDANFTNAVFGGTILTKIDLSQAQGLDTIHHQSVSTLGLDALHQMKGMLPDGLLRGVGVQESLVQRFQAMYNAGTQPLCLISYSSADQKFAERLHEDLRNRGVRCWFAPKDMPVGDRIRTRLEKSLRECDKVVLVLSRHSLAGAWAEKEAGAVLDRERADGLAGVLVPIALDEGVLTSEAQWVKEIGRIRPIGDFTKWSDPGPYQAALNSVLRDLTESSAPAAKAS